jgi:hypothetical protein
MTSAHQKAAQMLGAAADLLDQGQLLNRLSVVTTSIALAVLLLPVFPATAAMVLVAVLVVLAGLLQLYFAVRVGLDAALFRRLGNDAAEDRLDVAAFDSALMALRLLPASKSGFPIATRIVGAKRLLAYQGAAFLLQMLLAVAGGFSVYMEWM